jgi:NADPH:quinone reductase-like Zn-dependent oxidoreductase
MLATRPANLTFKEAAALPYGGLLALFFVRRADIKAGQHVLVYGASGPSAQRPCSSFGNSARR